MATNEFLYRQWQRETSARQAAEAAEAQKLYNTYAEQRGTMRPETNDPDAGVREYGDAVEMVYDEFEGAWVEQRKLSKP